ncbi:MAG: class I poly(R)-hydroxyalkanoic acid synthase, partial [Pseudolabrys sp.]|nr:class I poly(R)-hydroxyalkanoic acid synthase [Pseudolabrys sp.]
GSGHIAGVVNPPAKKKYQFWSGPKAEGSDINQWMAKAKMVEGSWWDDWFAWLKGHDDTMGPAPKIGGGKVKPIEDAPGSYVKMRE